MSLGENIRHYRIKNRITQDELAKKLCVSSQAVSKWETGNSCPDVSLIVPISEALCISCDTLLGKNECTMKQITDSIVTLMSSTQKSDLFKVTRALCFQIEKALFLSTTSMKFDTAFSEDDYEKYVGASYIALNDGFTLLSNGNIPFFASFPELDCGFDGTFENSEKKRDLFKCLSNELTLKAVRFLFSKPSKYAFDKAALKKNLSLSESETDNVINDIITLRLVRKDDVNINGESKTIYQFFPQPAILATLIIADQALYNGSYFLRADRRKTPFLKKGIL